MREKEEKKQNRKQAVAGKRVDEKYEMTYGERAFVPRDYVRYTQPGKEKGEEGKRTCQP